MNPAMIYDKYIKQLVRLVSIVLLAFLINAIILIITGQDVMRVYSTLFEGAFGDKWAFASSIRWALPLAFTGLAFAVSLRGGMFNIGTEGQLYFGAFAAAWVGFTFVNLPGFILVPLCFFAAAVIGSLWAMVAGWLKVRFHANEVVTTLMLNYIAILFTEYLIRYPFYQPGSAGESGASKDIAAQAQLTTLISGTNVTTGLILALLIIVFIYFWNKYTVGGFESNLVGNNDRFAKFSGLKVKTIQMKTMAMSGAIAGLGGAVEVLGIHHRFIINFSSNLGFDGVVVALLGNNHPLMIPFSALFMGAMKNGSISLEMFGNVPKAMVSILLGIIIMAITIKKYPKLNIFKKKRVENN